MKRLLENSKGNLRDQPWERVRERERSVGSLNSSNNWTIEKLIKSFVKTTGTNPKYLESFRYPTNLIRRWMLQQDHLNVKYLIGCYDRKSSVLLHRPRVVTHLFIVILLLAKEDWNCQKNFFIKVVWFEESACCKSFCLQVEEILKWPLSLLFFKNNLILFNLYISIILL